MLTALGQYRVALRRSAPLLVAAGLLLGGCPAPPETGGSRPLVIAQPGDVLSLDPAGITDNESMQVVLQIFEPLVRYRSGSTQVEPGLAERWEVTGGGTTWTFHLRRGVHFHDGTPLDAQAVVFSFERQRDPRHPQHFQRSPYWDSAFRDVTEVRAIGSHSVRIRIARPYAPFLANLALFPMSIVSPTAVRRRGRDFGQHPVGTGPFEFVRWDKGTQIVLARNERYWGGPPSVERLVYKVIAGAGQRLASLQSGAVDVVYGLAPEDRQLVKLHPDLRLHHVHGNNVAYLALHTGKPPFDRLEVRRAVNHAVDKNALVKLVYQGLGIPARGPIPPSLWSYNADTRSYPYDRARARQLLKQAGYDFSTRLKLLTMSTPRPYVPSPVLVARMIARYLRDVGMQVEVVSRPHGEHLAAVRAGEHHLCLLGWVGDNGDPDNFLHVLLDRDASGATPPENVAFFFDPRVHELVLQAQRVPDRGEREERYREAQRIIADQAPWVPLAHTEVVVASRRALRNLQPQPTAAVLYGKVEL